MKMEKTKIGVVFGMFILMTFLISSAFILAKPDNNGKSGISVVPPHAVQVANNVFSLGTAVDVNGQVVEGFMFVDDRKANAKPPWAGGGKKDSGTSTCFSLFAKGAKWKTTENYITGLGVNLALTETSLNTWDSEVGFNIFGTGASGATDGADNVEPDGKNEVMFENLGSTSTIAYTIVWGVFGGPPQGRKLVEWDAVFNTDYAWSETGEANKMDYQNIATHEFGHALGLGHPDSTCTEETMYAYGSAGETKKQTLEAGDVAGVNKLYS